MKRIGIIGAMPSELADIRAALPGSEIVKKAGFEYYVNRISEDIEVIHVCSGIAKVNAAVCTQALIDTFNPDAVINAGIAGGMNRAVRVCDIVISNEVCPHDLDLHFLKDYPPYCGIYAADEKLMELAARVCDEFGVQHFYGRIVSGEAFISDNAVKQSIQERLSPHAVDMESAAVGHCAYLNGVPYVSVRCISDNADDEGAMSFDQFEKIAAKRVADVVLRMAELF
ncbi:MAG: 5'-methylthioadenosine/adenosylhomocysteine nucleosidase [Ruminococcus sp.]|nr:5'-methylthioadenosine/adenosylhomocysteine nucleosidase [Ruminococcus sp.]